MDQPSIREVETLDTGPEDRALNQAPSMLLLHDLGERTSFSRALLTLATPVLLVIAWLVADSSLQTRALRGDGPDHYHRVADQAMMRGDIDGAIRALEEVLQRDPEDTAAALEASMALARSGRIFEASRFLESALLICPRQVDMHILLSRLDLLAGDLPSAESHALEATRWNQEGAEAQLLLGECLLSMERPKAAIYHLTVALEQDRRELLPFLDLAEAYRRAKSKFPAWRGPGPESVVAWAQLSLEPDTPASMRIRFLLEAGPEKRDEVSRLVDRIISEHPSDPEIRLVAAASLRAVDCGEEAVELQLAAAREGISGESLLKPILSRLAEADPEQARYCLDYLLTKDDQLGTGWLYLARRARRELNLPNLVQSGREASPSVPAMSPVEFREAAREFLTEWQTGSRPTEVPQELEITAELIVSSMVEERLPRQLAGRLLVAAGRFARGRGVLLELVRAGEASPEDFHFIELAQVPLSGQVDLTPVSLQESD